MRTSLNRHLTITLNSNHITLNDKPNRETDVRDGSFRGKEMTSDGGKRPVTGKKDQLDARHLASTFRGHSIIIIIVITARD